MTYQSISQDLVKKYLSYDHETGMFLWLQKSQGRRKSMVAGCVNNAGYIVIGINGTVYQAHRLAWVYVFGRIHDDLMIDHINGDRSDNRIRNLRLVTPYENSKNCLPRRDHGSPRVRYLHVEKAKNRLSGFISQENDKARLLKNKQNYLKKQQKPTKISRLTLMLQKKLACT